MNDTKKKIINFLKQFDECVIATVNEAGLPEAATVGFSENQKLELMVGTTKHSRKYQNIFRNQHVAVVVGFTGDITVQYEGMARFLEAEELAERKKLHFLKIPVAQVFERDPDQVYFSIAPTWIRYTDFTQKPNTVEELDEFS